MVSIRGVNPNAEIKKLCVLGYRRVVALSYFVTPMEKIWESKK